MPRYYRVMTTNGAILSFDSSLGELITVLETMPGDYYPAVLACAPSGVSDICFLAEEEGVVRISLRPQSYRNLLLPFGIHWLPGSQAAFLDPLTRRFLSVTPSPEPTASGPITAERSRLNEYGTFWLEPVAASQVSGRVRKWMTRIDRMFKAAPWELAEKVLDFVSRSEADAVLNAIWPLFGRADLETLGRILLANPAMRTRLTELLPDDIWAATGVPLLAEWLMSREAELSHARRFQVAREHDFLADAGFNGRLSSFGHACSTYARSTIAPRRKICIIATARNEGIYLLDWIAYHRCIGVEAFILYSNDNDDGSDELLRCLADAGIIVWIDNRLAPGRSAQNKAYGHAFGVLPNVLDYRWALVVDLDEFFVFEPSKFNSIGDFLIWQEMRDVDAIACNWVYVGSGTEGFWRDAPVFARNDRLLGRDHVGEGYRLVKAMSRPNRVIHSTPHSAITDERRRLIYRYATGELDWYRNHPLGYAHLPQFADEPNRDYACVYHYLFKSAEEFLWRLCRNRGDHPLSKGLSPTPLNSDLIRAFMEQHDAVHVERNDHIARCAPDFEYELARLKALPGIAETNGRVQCNFRTLIANVKRLFLSAPELLPGSEEQRRFLQLAGVAGL